MVFSWEPRLQRRQGLLWGCFGAVPALGDAVHARGWVCCWHRGTGGTSIPPQIVLLQPSGLLLCRASAVQGRVGQSPVIIPCLPPQVPPGASAAPSPARTVSGHHHGHPRAEPQSRGCTPGGGGLCQPGMPFAAGEKLVGEGGGSVSLCLLFASVSLKELGMACCSLGTAQGAPAEHLGRATPISLSFLLGSPSERGHQAPGAVPGTCGAVPAIKTQGAVFPNLLMLLISLLGWDAEKSQEWGHLM